MNYKYYQLIALFLVLIIHNSLFSQELNFEYKIQPSCDKSVLENEIVSYSLSNDTFQLSIKAIIDCGYKHDVKISLCQNKLVIKTSIIGVLEVEEDSVIDYSKVEDGYIIEFPDPEPPIKCCHLIDFKIFNLNKIPNLLVLNDAKLKLHQEVDEVYLKYSTRDKYGRIIAKFNLNEQRSQVVNDRFGIAFITYQYDDNLLIKKQFWSKDSIERGVTEFKYDLSGKLKNISSILPNGYEFEKDQKIDFKYNKKGLLIEKRYIGVEQRCGLGNPGLIKFEYNDKGQLKYERYFNVKEQKAIIGEPGFSIVEYFYDINEKLIQTIAYYSASTDPDAESRFMWLNEFFYDESGRLSEKRYKFEREGEKYDNITYFSYSEDEKDYGFGKDKCKIKHNIPYEKGKDIIWDHIYPSYFRKFVQYQFR